MRRMTTKMSIKDHLPRSSMICKNLALEEGFQGTNHAMYSEINFAKGKIMEKVRMRIAMMYNFAVHIRCTEWMSLYGTGSLNASLISRNGSARARIFKMSETVRRMGIIHPLVPAHLRIVVLLSISIIIA
tara:strand:- start:66 stop:455 length:390 start_codon:yes stop_codon:yes gene_type:complete